MNDSSFSSSDISMSSTKALVSKKPFSEYLDDFS